MAGINIAEKCHVVNMLPAVSISGGKTTLNVSMARAAHLSILLSFGVRGAANPTSVIVNQCTDATGANATAMPFRYYLQGVGGSGQDVFTAGPTFVAATGITTFPTSVANLVLCIEIDSQEVEPIAATVGSSTEYPVIQVAIADSGNTTYASVLGILSGLRYAYKGTPTVTA